MWQPDGSALATTAYTPDAADHLVNGDACHRQYVSDPLDAQTISGNVTAQFQCLEANAANNLFITLKILVCSNDGSTTRATLLAITRATSSEIGTALANRTFPSTALSSYACAAGDRLVVEIGVGGTPTATTGVQGHNSSLRFGGTASSGDLPVDETTTTTTYRPWIEFSNTLTPEPVPVKGPMFAETVASIGAAWTIVTAAPFFAAALFQPVPVDNPPASHASRSVDVQASIVSQWEPGPPAPQWNRKLPQGTIPPVVNDPPFSSRVREVQPELLWEQPSWSSQDRPPVPASILNVNDPPYNSREIRTEYLSPLADWSTQKRPTLVQPAVVVQDDPPFSRRGRKPQPELLWNSETWMVWPRVSLDQESVSAAVNDPPFSSRSHASVLTWYQPPVCAPLWASVLTTEGQAVASDNPPPQHAGRTVQAACAIAQSVTPDWSAPDIKPLVQPSSVIVNDPPFGRRPDVELIGLTWEPRPLAAVWGSRLVSAPAELPALHPGRLDQTLTLVLSWESPNWSAQQRPKLIQPSTQAVDNPPVRVAGRTVQAGGAIAQSLAPNWSTPSLRPLVQPSSVAVNDPPFSHRSRKSQPELMWEPLSWIVGPCYRVIQPGSVPDVPPIGRAVDRRIVHLWESPSWMAQRAPQGVQASVDVPPGTLRRPQLDTIIRSWDSETSIVRLAAHAPSLVPPVVNNPPWHARRLYQYVAATWTAKTWPTQSRIPLSVDGTLPALIVVRVGLQVSLAPSRTVDVSQELLERVRLTPELDRDIHL